MTLPSTDQPAAPGVTPCAECKDNKRCLEFGQCLAAYAHSLAAWQNALPPPAILGVTKDLANTAKKLLVCIYCYRYLRHWPWSDLTPQEWVDQLEDQTAWECFIEGWCRCDDLGDLSDYD